MKQILLVFGFTLLSGCAQLPKYAQPAGAEAPALTLINRSGGEVHVFGYADASECKDPISLAAESNYLDITDKPRVVRLKPNEPFTVQISLRSSRAGVRECFPVGTIVPKERARYVGTVSISQNICAFIINREENGVEVPDQVFIPRIRKLPFSGSFPACADRLQPQLLETPK